MIKPISQDENLNMSTKMDSPKSHSHPIPSSGRLMATMILNFAITITEVIGGLVSGSLSLLSDALHNFSDGLSIIISYIALRLGRRPGSRQHTFGLKRAEILAAMINATTLLAISIFLFREAWLHFIAPEEIRGSIMVMVAGIGLAANILGTVLLHRDAQHSMNIRASYLHLLSDVVSSIGVILGGLAIMFWKIYWIDPLLTVLISVYVLKASVDIVKQATHILMMGTPDSLELDKIQGLIEAVPGVINLHHVHIWMLNEHAIHFEAHVDLKDMQLSESRVIRHQIETLLADQFDIEHVTLQLECGECPVPELIV